eukprot:TRINITY_DN2021_c0_g1_i1.p1 TRINITY_DN2021_c0_g1~~TRINITY_DN2021_c0_g1_i1.p1  ORF type:complete len:116 (+),score=28.92 TRINITY_DN2021_c0_g1_i1:31-348(+)
MDSRIPDNQEELHANTSKVMWKRINPTYLDDPDDTYQTSSQLTFTDWTKNDEKDNVDRTHFLKTTAYGEAVARESQLEKMRIAAIASRNTDTAKPTGSSAPTTNS